MKICSGLNYHIIFRYKSKSVSFSPLQLTFNIMRNFCLFFSFQKVDDVLAEKMSYFRCRIYLSGRYFSNCQNDNFFLTHFNTFFPRRVRSALQIFKFFADKFVCWKYFLLHRIVATATHLFCGKIAVIFNNYLRKKWSEKSMWKRVSFPSIWTLFESVVSIEKSEKTCPSKNRFLFAINSIQFKRRGMGCSKVSASIVPRRLALNYSLQTSDDCRLWHFSPENFFYWNFRTSEKSFFKMRKIENSKSLRL